MGRSISGKTVPIGYLRCMKLTSISSLGQGGFGNVDLVQDDLGVRYARKTFSVNQPLPVELVPNVRKRFVREAKLQSGIKHRNVVPIIYMQLDGDAPWYLMPVADTSLDKEITKDRRLGGHYKLAISDIVSALEELHQMGMSHRDLKPQNVLKFVDANTGNPYYAVSDFGFVSLKDSRLSQLTYTGMKKGADYYTAPEITKDLRSATPQTDIFSVGCILHDMVGTEERVPCTEIREGGPFGALLLNCTRGKPDRRFQSAKVIRDILLSIDEAAPPVLDQDIGTIADKLDQRTVLSAQEIQTLAEFLEDHFESGDAKVILRKLSIDTITELFQTDAASAKRIGLQFAEWIAQRSAFDFDFCDVLASRAEAFYLNGDFDLQAEIAMGVLVLGTSHNRWYVERKFMALCGPTVPDGLAKRIGVEIRARGEIVCRDIEHLEFSISAEREKLHPHIVQALSETCSND